MNKRVLVDMSLTILHHGHMRLIEKASKVGDVIIGLTTDEEIQEHKGYTPELTYAQREEILLGMKYVKEVVPVNWKVTDKELDKYNIDILLHAGENFNDVTNHEIQLVDRTIGVCSSDIREKSMIIASTPKRNILLNPGPATTSQTVKMAQVVSDICPREEEFGDLMGVIADDLTSIVAGKDYVTTLFGGSGTAGVESCVASIPVKKILIINNGAYGQRMCDIADRYDIDYTEFKSSGVDALNIDELEKQMGDVDTLFAVHNETTTGLLNDIGAIGNVCKNNNTIFVVDAMSSYAAVPINMEKMNIDYLIASSNKNIQGMAGVSFVISSKTAIESLKNNTKRAYYLDLYDQYDNMRKNNQMRFTPPVQTIYALKQAIDETFKETVTGRYDRYSKSWEVLTNGLKKLGMTYLVEDANHSKIITSINLGDMDFDNLHAILQKYDITIYPGKVEGYNTFRVANIGDIDHNDISKFLEILSSFVQKNTSFK